MVDENRGNAKTNRGRSAEARDPNRPIDPTTGEKAGLGRRGDTTQVPPPVNGPETPPVIEDQPEV